MGRRAAIVAVVIAGAGAAFFVFRPRDLASDPAYAQAGRAEAAGQYQELHRLARELVRRYPRDARAYYVLGVAQGKLSAWDDAVASLRCAVARQPDFADAWNNLGWALSRQGKFAEAAAAFQALRKLNPTDAQACYHLGIVCAEQGQYVEAVEAFQAALKLNPGLADAWYNLGVVSEAQMQWDEAAVFYQEATKLRPDYADAWANLVKVYLRLGESAPAAAAARTLRELDSVKAAALAEELGKSAPE